MKKIVKKLMTIALAVVLIAAMLPMEGLAGVLKLSLIEVKAAEADPFDTSKLTQTGTGKYAGATWRTYDNGLLWVEDDTSGETSYGGDAFTVGTLLNDISIGLSKEDIKYIYWDITAPRSCSQVFYKCNNVLEIVFGNTFIGASGNIEDMYSMFEGCTNLTSLDISGFDTSNVADMAGMFEGCTSLTSLDISGFDTSNVEYMAGMFDGCTNLTSLDISGFDTSNVEYMESVFYGCANLTSLDLSSFDTSNVENMDYMFSGCASLTSLDISGFDTSNVTGMWDMFDGCTNLTSLDISGFDTSNVVDMDGMFEGCTSLTSLDISSFDTSNVMHMDDMFSGCASLHMIKLPKTHKKTDTSLYDGIWYKLNPDKTVDRSAKLEYIPVTTDESITIIREHNHQYSSVINCISTCDICGVKSLFGDCDSNGKVNVDDVILLKKYMVGYDVPNIDLEAANVNGDSAITVDDVIMIMKMLVGMEVKLGGVQ